MTNAIANAYIANRHAARREDAERAARYLKTRSVELRQELAVAEQAVEDFRATNVLRDGRETSLPATGPFRTVTVAAATCLDANIASTAAIVLGEMERLSRISDRLLILATSEHVDFIAHAPLASSLKAVAGHTFPECSSFLQALDVPPDMPPDEIEAQARTLLEKVRNPEALIFTDVFGATPCNVAQRRPYRDTAKPAVSRRR